MAQRIKGQETELILIVDGQIVDTLTAIKSFEFKYQLEIMSEGYLGEKTERKDSIFKGVSLSFELNFDSAQVFTLFQQIVDKAKRRTPGTLINAKTTLNFPNGERARIIIPNVEFGEIPVNFGSRSDYGSVSLDAEASDAQTLLS